MKPVLGDYMKISLHESIFFVFWLLNVPQSTGFSQTVGLGEGVGQSIHGGGNKQDARRGNIFGKIRNAGGVIHGSYSAGH